MTDQDREAREAAAQALHARWINVTLDFWRGMADAAIDAYQAALAAREDTERPDGSQGHRLDRSSFFCGYYSAANTLLYETIKPSNNPAVKDFAEHAWKATGADGVRDTEQEPER